MQRDLYRRFWVKNTKITIDPTHHVIKDLFAEDQGRFNATITKVDTKKNKVTIKVPKVLMKGEKKETKNKKMIFQIGDPFITIKVGEGQVSSQNSCDADYNLHKTWASFSETEYNEILDEIKRMEGEVPEDSSGASQGTTIAMEDNFVNIEGNGLPAEKPDEHTKGDSFTRRRMLRLVASEMNA